MSEPKRAGNVKADRMPVAVPDKTKAERLQETIRLLKKLQEIGFSEIDTGYNEIKALLSKWVTDGEKAAATVEFPRHGRRAEIELPKRADKAAGIALKVVAEQEDA